MMTLRFSLLGPPCSEDNDDRFQSDCLTLKLMALIKSILGLLYPDDGDNSFSILALFDPKDDATC
jgi:hypothetical protein